MEGYLFTDRVLQDSHMKRTKKFPCYLKKYDIKNSSIRYTDLLHHHYSLSHSPIKSEENKTQGKQEGEVFCHKETKKYKINFLLEEREKVPININKQSRDLSEFFIKKCIHPKLLRETSQRSYALFRPPLALEGNYYDPKINFVKKKTRNCIIFPENKKKKAVTQSTKRKGEKEKKVKEWIEEEYEEQRKKRYAECKTASQPYRQKNKKILYQEVKKMQEQLKSKEYEEVTFRNHYSAKSYRLIGHKEKENWKKTQPLTKEEMKQLSTSIMKKYGIDSSSYTQCVRKLL